MKYCSDFIVTEKLTLENNFFRLKLQSDTQLPKIEGGQFVQVLTKQNEGNSLRIPISINDVCYDTNSMFLLIQIVGEGTEALSRTQIGEKVNIIFPLGNGFAVEGNKVLMVGGGVGVAPFLYLAKLYNKIGIKPNMLIGARTDKHLLLLDEFAAYANVHITTQYGSKGTKGLVTEHSILSEPFDRIYCCGPTPMMKAVAVMAIKSNTPCYLSLEESMACGVGACLCCVVETTDGHNRCTCTEGPVFSALELYK
ncbi:MAG: dihydroorotate dehydrogenase electron transfer subunit [Bacteroidales bacterium]|jgi:dihydroorotate dehydrogenase electron transfer subunit|nr:dihydroorotate dehydrogenase electron transfer subunit [Bacteroidales bacterium]